MFDSGETREGLALNLLSIDSECTSKQSLARTTSSVGFKTESLDAEPGGDYVITNGIVTFDADESSEVVTITPCLSTILSCSSTTLKSTELI